MTRALPDEQRKALLAQIPLGPPRLARGHRARGRLPRVAGRGYITGATLHVNGGMYMVVIVDMARMWSPRERPILGNRA